MVGVADEQEVRARWDGLEEGGGEAVVEHRGLVDDEEIGGEGRGFVRNEAAAGGVVFEQAVNRRREAAGGLGKALRGAAGGRGEMDADFLGFQDFNEGAEDRGFSRSRSAGEDRELVGEGVFDGGALEFVEGEAGFVFGPFDGGVGLDGREGAADAAEAGDGGGDFLFGVVVVRKLDEGGAGEGRG